MLYSRADSGKNHSVGKWGESHVGRVYNGGTTVVARPEVVCQTQKITSDSCSGGQALTEKYVHFTF